MVARRAATALRQAMSRRAHPLHPLRIHAVQCGCHRSSAGTAGTGAGGGTLAHELAATGKRILLLERGGYLPREKDNWNSQAVFVDNKYKARETWYDKHGKPFHPGIHYWVGGNTKMYGAVLLRLRERDFTTVRHADGG